MQNCKTFFDLRSYSFPLFNNRHQQPDTHDGGGHKTDDADQGDAAELRRSEQANDNQIAGKISAEDPCANGEEGL